MTELARAYFRFYHGNEAYVWAEDAVERLFDYSLESAWGITLELINAAPSLESLSYIAAGQLEILCSQSGEEIIERLKNEALTNDKLLFAMKGVWLASDSPIETKFQSVLKANYSDLDLPAKLNLPDKLPRYHQGRLNE